MIKREVRRWRLWHCFNSGSQTADIVDAKEEIAWLEHKGFKAELREWNFSFRE